MSEQRGFDETKDSQWVDEADIGYGLSPIIQRNIGPSSALPPLQHPSTCAISPRSRPLLEPPTYKVSSVSPTPDCSMASNDFSRLLPRTLSRHEVQSPKPVTTVRKRKRVTPTLVSDLPSLEPDQAAQDKEVGQILMLLARASARVNRLSPLPRSSQEISYGTVGDLRSTRSCFNPAEISRQRSDGFMDPLEQGRAMLREKKQV